MFVRWDSNDGSHLWVNLHHIVSATTKGGILSLRMTNGENFRIEDRHWEVFIKFMETDLFLATPNES